MNWYPSRKSIGTLAPLAIPLVGMHLAQMGMEVVDTVMIGHLGVSELASAGLSGPAFFTILVFFIGLLSAIGIQLSRELGAENTQEISDWLSQGIWLAIIISLPAMLMIWHIPKFFDFLLKDSSVVSLSQEYLHSVVWSVPATFIYISFREYLCAMRAPSLVMWIALLAIPVDALFNYFFMFGFWFIPPLGIRGAGYSTALLSWLMLFLLLQLVEKNKKFSILGSLKENLKVDFSKIVELYRIGWPIGCTLVFEVGLFSVTATLMGYLGKIELAAHQIAMQASSITFMFYLGIAQATALLISHEVGARNREALGGLAVSGVLLAVLVALFASFLFLFYPYNIAQLFLNDSEMDYYRVIKLAVEYLAISALFQFSDAVQVVMNSALRGLKDTVIPMILGLGSYWLIGISVGCWLAFKENRSGHGLWWGLVIGLTFSGAVLTVRYVNKVTHSR